MRILFDHGAPAPLIPLFIGHTVTKAKDAGWDRLANGALLDAAEAAGFETMVTTDKNMHYQQNLTGRRISIIISAMPNGQRCAATLIESLRRSTRQPPAPLPR